MIIRAIDIGYQVTKLATKKDGEQFKLMSFPSIAPLRNTSMDIGLLSGGLTGSRNTKIVNVDGMEYEVGVDAADLQTSDTVKALDANYVFTDTYKAIYLGALSYLGEEEIDLLVLGLPITNLRNAQKLKERSIGTFQLADGQQVVVKDVLVIAQPLGGLYAAFNTQNEKLKDMNEQYNLIVDPGSVTFDFLTTNGIIPVENRSDAHHGGMLKVLMAISNSILDKYGKEFNNYSAIEKALLTKERKLKLPWNDEPEDLLEHIKNTRSVIESSVTAMKNKVGDGTEYDLHNIIVVGGGASIYRKQIEQQYADYNVVVLDDVNIDGLNIDKSNYAPIYANLIGYLIAGSVAAKRLISEL